MEVKAIVPRGYCKGVVNAINIAKKASQKPPVYILGMIVHNQYIVNALEELGVKTIDYKGKTRLELLDDIDDGTVIDVYKRQILVLLKQGLNLVERLNQVWGLEHFFIKVLETLFVSL